jgi:L1 cell adhesion molecule like protein
MHICEKAIQDSKISKIQIDDIVLVGGSTRIPKIRSMLTELFDGK